MGCWHIVHLLPCHGGDLVHLSFLSFGGAGQAELCWQRTRLPPQSSREQASLSRSTRRTLSWSGSVVKWICFHSFTWDPNPAQPHQKNKTKNKNKKKNPSEEKEMKKNTGTWGPPWKLAAIQTGSLSNQPREGRIRSQRPPGKTQTTGGRTLSLMLEAFQMYTLDRERGVKEAIYAYTYVST